MNKLSNCKKCGLWKTRKNVLLGEGDKNANLMLIAQSPGEYEDRENKMFIGPSGKILDELLAIVGISREEIYITNLIKCMLPNCRNPKQEEIENCSEYLDKEIEIIKAKTLVPLGFYATKYIFSKYSLPEFSKKEFHTIVGKLIWAAGKNIYPLTHPAALLYNINYKNKTIDNYRKLKVLSKECKWYQVCPLKWFYENGKLEEKWIELFCKGDWESCIRFQMEETGKYHPDNMLPDGSINEKL